jgi:hypothetical protein
MSDMNHNDYVSVGEMLTDILRNVNDEDLRIYGKGYYIRQVKNAMKELTFDTKFLEYYCDVDMPDDGKLEFPKGAFEITDLFVLDVSSESEEAMNGTNCLCDTSALQKQINEFQTELNNFVKKTFTINIPIGSYVYTHNFGSTTYSISLKDSLGGVVSTEIVTASDANTITFNSNVAYTNAQLILE